MNLWAAVGFSLALATQVRAADVKISLKDEPERFFSGENRSLPLLISNSGQTTSIALDYRIFQLAGGVAAEIGSPTAWKQVPLNAGQTVLETLHVNLPQVNAPVQFVVKLFEAGATDAIATLRVETYPTNFLVALKDPLKDYDITVFDEKDEFARALEAGGFQVTRVKNLSDPILADKPIFLVAATSPSAGELADLSKVATAIVCFWPANGHSLDRLPIQGQTKNRAFVVRCERALLKDFGDSPTAQMNFIRAAQYALRRSEGSSKHD